MAEVTLSTVVDLALIKMKWRETYVSEGLNRKVVPTTPAGLYQGFRMIENVGSPRQVEITPDADTGYHMAVFQSTTGFSLTYWDIAGTTIILDLSDANLDNQETIIAMEMDYQVGVDTTADWKAFAIADFDALPAARRADLIILGTINVPPGANNITTAMITFNRMSMPWKNVSKGAIAWRQVIKNSSFEYGDITVSTQGIPFWVGSGSLITWSRVTFDAVTGSYSVQPNVQAGPFSDSLSQRVGVEALEGQRVLVEFNKKVTFVSTTGTVSFRLTFKDDSGNDLTPLNVAVDDSVLDGSFVTVSETLTAPANAAVLDRVEIFMDTMTYAGSGGAILFDDVQVYVETSAATAIANTGEPVDASQVVIRSDDPTVDYDNQSAALLTYDDAVGIPSNGTLSLGSVSGGAPVLDVAHLVIGSNSGNGGTSSNYARVIAPVADAGGGAEFTLIWESVPPGEKGYRKYISVTGTIIETVNSDYNNNSNVWGKDVNGEVAFRIVHSSTGVLYEHQIAGTNSWAEGSWVTNFTVASTGINIAGTVSHGDRVLMLHANSGNYVGIWGSFGHNGADEWKADSAGDIIVFGVPLIAGDRIKSVQYSAFGGDAGNKGSQFRRSLLSTGVATTLESEPSQAVAGFYTRTWNISDILLTSDTLITYNWAGNNAGDEFYGVAITYDHP
jgi:hypothetical protein